MIISNNLVEFAQSCTTDKDVGLYSGAPFHGHVPVIASFQLNVTNKNKKATEKINIDKICWEKWAQELETTEEEGVYFKKRS